MKVNMGGSDRMVRFLLGVVLVMSAAVGALGGWAYLGLIAVVTGLAGRCPAYALFGFSTCRAKDTDQA